MKCGPRQIYETVMSISSYVVGFQCLHQSAGCIEMIVCNRDTELSQEAYCVIDSRMIIH